MGCMWAIRALYGRSKGALTCAGRYGRCGTSDNWAATQNKLEDNSAVGISGSEISIRSSQAMLHFCHQTHDTPFDSDNERVYRGRVAAPPIIRDKHAHVVLTDSEGTMTLLIMTEVSAAQRLSIPVRNLATLLTACLLRVLWCSLPDHVLMRATVAGKIEETGCALPTRCARVCHDPEVLQR